MIKLFDIYGVTKCQHNTESYMEIISFLDITHTLIDRSELIKKRIIVAYIKYCNNELTTAECKKLCVTMKMIVGLKETL